MSVPPHPQSAITRAPWRQELKKSVTTALFCSGCGCFYALAENLKIKRPFLAPPALQGLVLKLFLLPHP